MTMHLVRGMTSLNTKRRRSKKKTTSILAEEEKLRKLLLKVGYERRSSQEYRTELPDYRVSKSSVPTSDVVMRIEEKKTVNQYTGDEIIGIGTLHKSNMVPIRKDSEAAKEIAQMRRN